ncbi:MAG: hypothetical protein SFT92_02425 [Rickettsiales bacterium]|nr:hypothetical protein [Rickettsiales bacterium]
MLEDSECPPLLANPRIFKPSRRVLTTAFGLDPRGADPRLVSDEQFEKISAAVEELGFTQLSVLIRSTPGVVVLEANNGQQLRITYKPAAERPTAPQVLKPLKTVAYDGGVIEILPKVRCLGDIIEDPDLSKHYGITERDVPSIVQNLFHGLPNAQFVKNVDVDGIGIIPYNGINVPVVVEPQVTVDVPLLWASGHIAGHPQAVHQSVAFPFEDAQKQHMAELGLQYGEHVPSKDAMRHSLMLETGSSEGAHFTGAAGASKSAAGLALGS